MWPIVNAMLCHWWRKEGQGSQLQQSQGRRRVRGKWERRGQLGVHLLNRVGHRG